MATLDREREIKSMMFNCDKDEWIVMWEHEFNEKEKDIRNFVGDESLCDLVDKLNPCDSIKGGKREVFRMHCVVCDPSMESIRYLDVNALYPYVMSITEFLVGHPVIRRRDVVCRHLLDELAQRGEEFIGLCQVRVVATNNLVVPCLAHKMDGKLMFLLCKACAMCGKIQRTSCCHDEKE